MKNIFHYYLRSRWERYYLKNKWHIVLDLSLIMLVLILSASLAFLHIYRPPTPILDGFVKPPININNPPLDISYSLADATLDRTEPIKLQITVKNPGTKKIDNVKIGLRISSASHSLTNLEISNENSQQITTSGSDLLISEIAAGQERVIDLSAYFKSQPGAGRVFELSTQTLYLLNSQEYRVSSSLGNIYINADLVAKVAAYYTSPQGDQLGIGPLPPLVGIPTKYWIFWEAQGSGDFRSVSLSAKLPAGITMTGEQALLGGELNFNPGTRLIIWKLPEVRPQDGNRAGFEVEFMPQESQVGQVIVLVESGRIFGDDILTGELVSKSFSEQTTNLDLDKFNAGNGVVQRP